LKTSRSVSGIYGYKTLYNRFDRWSRMGIFDRIFVNVAAESGPPDRVAAGESSA